MSYKIAVIKEVNVAKLDLPDGFKGDFVVVPADFPDEVCLMVWSHHYEARERRVGGGKSFMTHPPQPTPEEAREAFMDGDYGKFGGVGCCEEGSESTCRACAWQR